MDIGKVYTRYRMLLEEANLAGTKIPLDNEGNYIEFRWAGYNEWRTWEVDHYVDHVGATGLYYKLNGEEGWRFFTDSDPLNG